MQCRFREVPVKNFLNLTTFAVLTLMAFPVLAAQMHLEARVYSSTDCTYFSNTLGDFHIQYLNPGLPEGTLVEFIYGFNDANNEKSNWINPQTVALDYSLEKGIFQKTITANVNSRGGRRASAIQFVPDGPEKLFENWVTC